MHKFIKSFFQNIKSKISHWNKEKLDDKKINKISNILFLVFFFIYLLASILIFYNHNLANNWSFIFNSDTVRVVDSFTDIVVPPYTRLYVHPLIIVLIQPLIFLIQGITQDASLACAIFSACISALTIKYCYKFIALFGKFRGINLIFTLIYAFSFSTFVFTSATIELYNISALVMILLWYLIAKILKQKKALKNDYLFLVCLGIILPGITITNYVIFLIASLVLLCAKVIPFKKLVGLNLIVVALFCMMSFVQNFIWHNTDTILDSFNATKAETSKDWVDYSINFDKVKTLVATNYYRSLIGSDMTVNTINHAPILAFTSMNVVSIILITLFWCLLLYYVIRNFQKNSWLNVGLGLCLLFNSVFHCIYGNDEAFLYSQHFLYLIILLFAINFTGKSKLIYTFLSLFVLYEAFTNIFLLNVIRTLARENIGKNYWSQHFNVIILALIIILFMLIVSILIYQIIKKIKDYISNQHNNNYSNRTKLFFEIILRIILIECCFVTIATTPKFEKLLWIDLKDPGIVNSLQTDSIFGDKYSSEIKQYQIYDEEYSKFVERYNITLNEDYKDINFYLFGMGNRTKILFKDNKLIDIFTKKTLYEWNVKDYVIIPNIYTVLIRTFDNTYYKIYENDNGVYIQKFNKKAKLIKGTDKHIDLYNFAGQEYSNVKKVLYNEILFNIKDGKVYPNIIVYDKPWYRDAALAGMVLKSTNNVSLIEDWISHETEIYDKQNAGISEPDNLGELLYLISISKNGNKKLENSIIKEAEKIASNNEDGYYIIGKTDFSELNNYQNLWYKFGIDSVHKTTDISYKGNPDRYNSTAWWANQTNKNKLPTMNSSKQFPYLSWAQYHTIKKGKIFSNVNFYPLSWEQNASQADYSKMKVIDDYFVNNKISPVHTWMASEMLLFLLDDTGDLDI